MQLHYDPTYTPSAGYWQCQQCGSKFYTSKSGEAVHTLNCPSLDYTKCTYTYGDTEVRRLRVLVNRQGKGRPGLQPVEQLILAERGLGAATP